MKSGHEVGHSVQQRILDVHARRYPQRRHPQRLRAHRSAGLGEHRVEPHRLQQRGLAGHVRARDQEEGAGGTDFDIVGHAGPGGQERVAEGRAVKGGGVGVERGEDPVGVVGGEGGEGGEGLGFARRVEPVADADAATRLPAFERGEGVHVPVEDHREGDVKQGRPADVGHVEEAAQGGDLAVGGPGAAAEAAADLGRVRGPEGCAGQVGEQRREAPDPRFTVVGFVGQPPDPPPGQHVRRCGDHQRPGQRGNGDKSGGIRSDGGQVDRGQHEAGDAQPAGNAAPPLAFRPLQKLVDSLRVPAPPSSAPRPPVGRGNRTRRPSRAPPPGASRPSPDRRVRTATAPASVAREACRTRPPGAAATRGRTGRGRPRSRDPGAAQWRTGPECPSNGGRCARSPPG